MKSNKILTVVFALSMIGGMFVFLQNRLSPLHERLVSKDDDVRAAAFIAARGMNPVERTQLMVKLIESRQSPDPRERRFALYALRKLTAPAPQTVRLFLESALDPDPAIAEEAVISLTESGKTAVEPLAAIIASQEKPTHDIAFRVLKNLGAPSVPALTPLLTDKKAAVRADALAILSQIGPEAPEALPALRKIIANRSDPLRFAAAVAMNHIDPKLKETIPVHMEALKSRSWDEGRMDTVRALEKLGPAAQAALPALRQTLMETLKSPNPTQRQAVMQAYLAVENRSRSSMEILQDLNAADPVVRAAAIHRLNRMKPIPADAAEAIFPALAQAFEKKKISLKQADDVLSAFAKGSEQLIAPYLEHVDDDWRLLAALSLGRWESRAEGVVPALVRGTKQGDVELRERAKIALQKAGKI